MSASNFGDSMEWSRGRSSSSLSPPSSSGSRKGKRATGSSSVKPRQPQRGLVVAQLERIRLQSEMAEYLHHPALGQPAAPSQIHGTSSLNLEDARLSKTLPSSPSSSFHDNTDVSSPYPIHPNLVIAYNGGRGSDMRYGESRSSPIIRPAPNYHGGMHGAAAHYSHPSTDITLPLFEAEGQQGLNQSVPVDSSLASMNSDDPQDVDLELKL